MFPTLSWGCGDHDSYKKKRDKSQTCHCSSLAKFNVMLVSALHALFKHSQHSFMQLEGRARWTHRYADSRKVEQVFPSAAAHRCGPRSCLISGGLRCSTGGECGLNLPLVLTFCSIPFVNGQVWTNLLKSAVSSSIFFFRLLLHEIVGGHELVFYCFLRRVFLKREYSFLQPQGWRQVPVLLYMCVLHKQKRMYELIYQTMPLIKTRIVRACQRTTVSTGSVTVARGAGQLLERQVDINTSSNTYCQVTIPATTSGRRAGKLIPPKHQQKKMTWYLINSIHHCYVCQKDLHGRLNTVKTTVY